MNAETGQLAAAQPIPSTRPLFPPSVAAQEAQQACAVVVRLALEQAGPRAAQQREQRGQVVPAAAEVDTELASARAAAEAGTELASAQVAAEAGTELASVQVVAEAGTEPASVQVVAEADMAPEEEEQVAAEAGMVPVVEPAAETLPVAEMPAAQLADMLPPEAEEMPLEVCMSAAVGRSVVSEPAYTPADHTSSVALPSHRNVRSRTHSNAGTDSTTQQQAPKPLAESCQPSYSSQFYPVSQQCCPPSPPETSE